MTKSSKVILVGFVVATASSFFAFEPAERANLLYRTFLSTWPYLLLILAVIALFHAFEERVPALIAILFASAATVGMVDSSRLNWSTALNLAPWIGIAIGSGLVIRTTLRQHARHVFTIIPRYVRASHGLLSERTQLTGFAGFIRYDARSATLSEDSRIAVKLLAAKAVVLIPREWRCHLEKANLSLAEVKEEGPIPTSGPMIKLEVAAWWGVLIVRRL